MPVMSVNLTCTKFCYCPSCVRRMDTRFWFIIANNFVMSTESLRKWSEVK